MPVWQALYEEFKSRNFIIIAVALDTGGEAAVRRWIRPAEPIEVPARFQDIMGWTSEQYRNSAVPTYPCLIDRRHVVAELYDIRNVPMSVWIDEAGRIVRPAEPTGATDGFRFRDRATSAMPAEYVEAGKVERKRYVDALRDWVTSGSSSVYALSEDEARARVAGPSETDVLAAAHFRLGQYLFDRGDVDRARRSFAEASRLVPERWHYFRQALELEGTGNGSGPAFAAAIAELGDRPYYAPVRLEKSAGS